MSKPASAISSFEIETKAPILNAPSERLAKVGLLSPIAEPAAVTAAVE